jgi:hypothetical protein
MTKLRTIVQEAIDLEIQEIFGLFGKPKTPLQGPGSTEQLPQDPVQQTTPKEKFSLLALKQLKTSKKMRDYVKRTLQLVSSPGQARAAYAIDENTVLKIALSDNKTYQNKNEVENSKCLGPTYSVKVLSFHPRYIWIVEERVRPITSSKELTAKFNELTNIEDPELRFRNSMDIQEFLSDMPSLLSRTTQSNGYQYRHDLLMSSSSWYRGLLEKLNGCQVASWDFHKDNWGIRPSTGELVLLDIGFNRTELSPEAEFLKEMIGVMVQEETEHGFNLSALKTLKNLEDVHRYCYETLGNETMNGATRMTWIIDDSKVLKVVYREKDSNENQNEVKNAKCLGERYAVKIFDYDHEQFFWVVEERVKGFPTAFVVPEFVEMMNRILGTNYDDWFPIMQLFFHGTNPEKEELMSNNEWFREIVHKLENCEVGSHDLHPGNWGIRQSTGELVILDLGF